MARSTCALCEYRFVTRAEADAAAALAGRRADRGGDMRRDEDDGPAMGMISSTISISDFSGEKDSRV